MVEQCGYCQTVHDTGDGSVTYRGRVLKTCPMVPLDQVYMVAPALQLEVLPEWFELKENEVIDF